MYLPLWGYFVLGLALLVNLFVLFIWVIIPAWRWYTWPWLKQGWRLLTRSRNGVRFMLLLLSLVDALKGILLGALVLGLLWIGLVITARP